MLQLQLTRKSKFHSKVNNLSTKTGDTTSCVQVGNWHCPRIINCLQLVLFFCRPSDSNWEIFFPLSSSSARSRHLSGESRTHQGRSYLQMKCLPTNQNLNFSSNSEANLNAKHLLTKWSFRVSLEKLGDEASLESTRFSKKHQIIIYHEGLSCNISYISYPLPIPCFKPKRKTSMYLVLTN